MLVDFRKQPFLFNNRPLDAPIGLMMIDKVAQIFNLCFRQQSVDAIDSFVGSGFYDGVMQVCAKSMDGLNDRIKSFSLFY